MSFRIKIEHMVKRDKQIIKKEYLNDEEDDVRIKQEVHSVGDVDDQIPDLHPCDICEIAFTSYLTLKDHKKQEHMEDFEKITLIIKNEADIDIGEEIIKDRTVSKIDNYFKTCKPTDQESTISETNSKRKRSLNDKIIKNKTDLSKNKKDESNDLTLSTPKIGSKQKRPLREGTPKNRDVSMTNNSSKTSESQKKNHTTNNSEVEPKLKKHLCEVCNKRFSKSSNLKSHLISIHLQQKNFKCDQCKAQFTRKWHLKRHIEKHAEEMKFECEKCDRKFTRKDLLRHHLITIHCLKKKIRKLYKRR